MANVDHVIGALVIAVSVTALAEIAFSLPRGKIRHSYGSWDRFIS